MTENLGQGRNRSDAQYAEYIADMILELQGLAQRSGHDELSAQLLIAYEAARQVGEAGVETGHAASEVIPVPSDFA